MALEKVGVQLEAAGEAQYNAALKRAEQATAKLGDAAMETAQEFTRQGGDLSQLNSTLDQYVRRLKAVTPENAQLAQEAAKVTDAFESGKISADEARTALERIQQQIPKNTQAMTAHTFSWTEFNNAMGVVKQGLQEAKKVFDQTVGITQTYNQEILQLSRITGTGTEETSRLVQMADDLGMELGIVETAARGAAMKGIALTTANLAKMSDEYLHLAPGVDRNTYLLDNFGRSGLEMARIMEKGSKKIKDMSDAVADNMVVTQDAADASEKYRVAVDDLNDSVTGLKYSVGNALIPVLEKQIRVINGGKLTTEEMISELGLEAHATEILSDEIDSATRSYIGMGNAIKSTVPSVIELTGKSQDMNQVTQDYNISLGVGQRQQDAWKRSVEAAGVAAGIAALSMKPMTAEILLANSGLKEGTPEWWEFARSLGLVDEAAVNMATKLQLARAEFEKTGDMERYWAILRGLKQDILGIPAFVNTTWNIGISQGSQAVYNAMQNAINASNRGGGGAIPSTSAAPGGSSSSKTKAHATGGPVSAGWPYMVGERGPEPFIPAMNGYILSKADAERIYASQVAASIPASIVSAGPSSYSYSHENNYNLSVMTSQSAAVVQRSFAIMKLLSG